MVSLSSSTKVWLFILSTSLVLLAYGYSNFGRLGLILSFFAALGLNALIFVFGDFKLYGFFKSTAIKGRDAYGLNALKDELCQKLQLSKPEIRIYESEGINAFTLGLFWSPPTIFLSTALLNTLSSEEIKNVLTAGLVQVKRTDSFGFSVVSVLANTVWGFAQWVDKIIFLKPFHKKKIIFFEYLARPIAWFLVKSIANYESFYKTDQHVCQILKDKRQYCELLWKLEGFSKTCPGQIPKGTSHLFLVHPDVLSTNFFDKIQPSVAKRIIHLIGHSPL